MSSTFAARLAQKLSAMALGAALVASIGSAAAPARAAEQNIAPSTVSIGASNSSSQYRYAQSAGKYYATPSSKTSLGRLDHGSRYLFKRWDGKSRRDQIKVGTRWVWTGSTNRKKPAADYRYAQNDGTYYATASGKSPLGHLSKGQRYQFKTWDDTHRRDRIKVGTRWVWTSSTARSKPTAQFRYAQSDGAYYATASSGKPLGKLVKGQRYSFKSWDSKHRRDQIYVNRSWVWTSSTDRTRPATAPKKSQQKQSSRSTKIGAAFFEGLSMVSTMSGLKVPSIYVSGTKGRPIQLQQKVGGKWKVIKDYRTNDRGFITNMPMPKHSHGHQATFRMHAPARDGYRSQTSKSVRIAYQDPRKVTGLAKEIRDQLKAKCPTTVIGLAPTAKFKGWAASAHGAENRIMVYKHLNRNRSDWKSFVKYLARHECGHLLIRKAMLSAGVTDASASLNKLFRTSGNNGVELMADAIATEWGASPKHNAYANDLLKNGKFTSAQKQRARGILAGRW